MKKTHFLTLLVGFILLIGCNSCKERIIEKFSEEKPYAIQLVKERSYFQTEKLVSRLHGMNIDAYAIQFTDSIDNDGSWFYILCGNIETIDSAKTERDLLETKFKLKELKVVKYSDFLGAKFELDLVSQEEKQKIMANKPSIKEDIFDVISKFPESNSLYLQKTSIVNTPTDKDDLKGFHSVYELSIDLPRGITKKMVLQNMTAFCEVVYKDNLYGDKVTIDIGKLRNVGPKINQASIISLKNKESFEIAAEYADLILETGVYLFEEKKEIEVNAFVKLYGYKVTIEPKKNYFRTYLILVDETSQYIYFCQSTEKTESELLEILVDLGRGDGLNSYDEFYNSFYTLPEAILDNDWFIAFTIDRLGWSYAKNKSYTTWSKEMVGHWNSTGYFYNLKKGLWTYTIFDMLTYSNQNYIYGDLYSGSEGDNKKKQKVYSTDGFVIYEEKINWKTWSTYKTAIEINFGISRFIVAVNNSTNSWLTKNELIERAESFQFADSIGE